MTECRCPRQADPPRVTRCEPPPARARPLTARGQPAPGGDRVPPRAVPVAEAPGCACTPGGWWVLRPGVYGSVPLSHAAASPGPLPTARRHAPPPGGLAGPARPPRAVPELTALVDEGPAPRRHRPSAVGHRRPGHPSRSRTRVAACFRHRPPRPETDPNLLSRTPRAANRPPGSEVGHWPATPSRARSWQMTDDHPPVPRSGQHGGVVLDVDLPAGPRVGALQRPTTVCPVSSFASAIRSAVCVQGPPGPALSVSSTD